MYNRANLGKKARGFQGRSAKRGFPRSWIQGTLRRSDPTRQGEAMTTRKVLFGLVVVVGVIGGAVATGLVTPQQLGEWFPPAKWFTGNAVPQLGTRSSAFPAAG